MNADEKELAKMLFTIQKKKGYRSTTEEFFELIHSYESTMDILSHKIFDYHYRQFLKQAHAALVKRYAKDNDIQDYLSLLDG